jgi:hypothetical protein
MSDVLEVIIVDIILGENQRLAEKDLQTFVRVERLKFLNWGGRGRK